MQVPCRFHADPMQVHQTFWAKMAPRALKKPPRCFLDAPRALKTRPRRFKSPSRGPKCLQGERQDALRTGLGTSKISKKSSRKQCKSQDRQNAAKSSPDVPKTASRALKMPLRRPQELSKRSQLGPKSAQDAPNSGPRVPGIPPRPSQERPRGLQDRPKSAQEAYKTTPRAPKTPGRLAQERPYCCLAAIQIAKSKHTPL